MPASAGSTGARYSGTGTLADGRRGTLGGQALEQFGSRLVGRVLRHEFAAKGLGEQGRRQLADLPAGGGETGFEAVGEGEKDFDAADDFGLFLFCWYQNFYSLNGFCIHIGLCDRCRR